jgi:hypothetical protein
MFNTKRVHWCDTVLNVYLSAGDKCDVKDSFYEKLQHAFDQFPKVPYEHFFFRFKCKGQDRRYFKTGC